MSQGLKTLRQCCQLNCLWYVKKLFNSVDPSEDADAKSVTVEECRIARITFRKLAPRLQHRCFEKFLIVMTGTVDNGLSPGITGLVQFVKIRSSGAPICMEIGILKLVLQPARS